MKAAQVKEYGKTEKIVLQEIVKPTPGEGQALVMVMAAAVNPFDVILASGAVAEMIPLNLPYTIGGDFAGVVEGTGQEVFGTANVAGKGSGSMAESTAANTKNIAAKPPSLSWSEAASLPLSGSSALQAIGEHIDLQPGQKILVHGGAGGIGTMAIQLAKSRGAYVASTATRSDSDLLTGLGADMVIDYKSEDFTTKISDYDAVFDTVGKDIWTKLVGQMIKMSCLV